MKQIIDGIQKFQRDIYPEQKARYRELVNGQHPHALFIGCSDSRVVPELFMQQGPGDLFVARNVGNIVPPYTVDPSGVSSSIEYAVAVLKVPDVIICGHSGCGAMTAVLNGKEKLQALPETARWLSFSDAAEQVVAEHYARKSNQEKLNALVQENVLAQLRNLLTHPSVASAIQEKKVRLHGWVFDIATASVTAYDADADAFVPLSQSSLAGAKI